MGQRSADFERQLQQSFDAARVGQTYTYRRTFSEGDVALFCGVTGDFNPYHTDETFARASGFGRRIIPGLLTGSMLTHIGGMLGFLAADMTFRFLAPVYVGDTVTCVVSIGTKDEARRRLACGAAFTNQDGVVVAEARFTGFPSQVRLAHDPQHDA